MRRLTLLLVLLGGVAACTQAAPDPRGVARDEVLLQVSAVGRAEARPDEARFSAGVNTIGATAAAASTQNNAAMGRLIAALEGAGVAADDIQTRQITLSRIDYGRDRGRYSAGNMVEVRVRDLAKAGGAIAAATEAGGNLLSGPELRVSSQDAVDNLAYAEAYKSARARAEAYAKAADMKVVRVLGIRDAGADGPILYGPPGMGVATEQATNASAPIRGGMNSREVRVRADFALGK